MDSNFYRYISRRCIIKDLVFATVTIGDSKDMQKLTEAAVRDSAAMKQIAFLTMLYLPPSFIAVSF
jgi:hypothetical protein